MQRTLSDWLTWIKSIHVKEMDLSLERVIEVGQRLNLLNPTCPVITVAGTNGKGSCVAGLEAIYLAAEYRVGAFTTPILFDHNEQVRIQGENASDAMFCEAYNRIELHRGSITLTPFEFNTLAAFEIFHQANLDVWLLEVGLGGRWDAVNAIDTDVAVITSIGIDHAEWLGDTREAIGFEKAGIFRHNKPVVCGDMDPPQSLLNEAKKLTATFFQQGKDFGFRDKCVNWDWWSDNNIYPDLPKPNLALQNMATVLKALDILQNRLPVTRDAIVKGLNCINLPGRIQVIPGEISQIFDVSHNPAAVEVLADFIKKNPTQGKTRAVFSMFMDKDIVASLQAIKNLIDTWFVAPIAMERGAPIAMLLDCFAAVNIASVQSSLTIKAAYQAAMDCSKPGDRVVVFGSFRTVAEVMTCDSIWWARKKRFAHPT